MASGKFPEASKGQTRDKAASGNFPEAAAGQTRDKVGGAVGMSGLGKGGGLGRISNIQVIYLKVKICAAVVIYHSRTPAKPARTLVEIYHNLPENYRKVKKATPATR